MRPDGEGLRWERRDSGAVPERRVDTPEASDGEWRVGKSPWWLRVSTGAEGTKAVPRVYGRHAGWLVLRSGAETCRVRVTSDLRAPGPEWRRGVLRVLPSFLVALALSALALLVSQLDAPPASSAETAKVWTSSALDLTVLPVVVMVLSFTLRGRSGLLPSIAGLMCGLLVTAGLSAGLAALAEPSMPPGGVRELLLMEIPPTCLGALAWAAMVLGPRTGVRAALTACAACLALPVLLYLVTLILLGAFTGGGMAVMMAAVGLSIVLAICAWGADLCGYLAPVRVAGGAGQQQAGGPPAA